MVVAGGFTGYSSAQAGEAQGKGAALLEAPPLRPALSALGPSCMAVSHELGLLTGLNFGHQANLTWHVDNPKVASSNFSVKENLFCLCSIFTLENEKREN